MYTLKHIDTISEKLGIPWEQSKDQPFSSSFTYLGFHWDIDNKQVTLIDHKREKYCQAIRDWNLTTKHRLQDMEKLHGKLLHATHVIPKGRAYLSSLERLMVTQCNKPHVPLSSPKDTEFELDWWLHALSSHIPPRPIPTPT